MMSRIISAYATPCTIVVQSTPDHKLLVSGTLEAKQKEMGGGGGGGGVGGRCGGDYSKICPNIDYRQANKFHCLVKTAADIWRQ